MQILIPDSWLRDFIDTDATPKQIQKALSLCGPSVERLHKKGNEYIYDIEVTTNRVDMMSVSGIAFECMAILPRFGYKTRLKKNPYSRKINLNTSKSVNYLNVKIDKKLCPRFSAVLIRNVQVKKSPQWLTSRLELAGLRGLNNVVDISNYLMLEMGQPVHTFDYDKIAQAQMLLRESEKGEMITTLDGKRHTLPGGDIVIEDRSCKIIDLCGIMGGLNSAVDENTKNVLLFVQVYEPSRIRKTSMSLSHRTDAAVLFEKGLPTENVLPTLQLGIKLFADLTEGESEKTIIDVLNIKEKNTVLKLNEPITGFINQRLGINLKFAQISDILKSLEFAVKSEHEIEVPWARKLDITIPQDLVEEVARIYGYHNLPSKLMVGELPTLRSDDYAFFWESKIKSALSHWGFTETYTNSLLDKDSGLKLKNPLSSEWVYLRTGLALSHEKIVSQNLGRVKEINLFEIANVYLPRDNNLPEERLHLAITTTRQDISYLKGIVEALFNYEMGITVGSEGVQTRSYDNCLIFETDLTDAITRAKNTKTYTQISKFSPIIEDINVTIQPKDNYDKIVQKLKTISSLITNIELIDKYQNKLTLRLTFHDPSKQLSSEDISPLRSRLVA